MKKTDRSKWAAAVKQRDGYRCQICGEEGTNAHHILCEGYFRELSLELDNGITLCRKCYTLAHRGKFGARNKGKYSYEYSFEELRKRAAPFNKDSLIHALLQGDLINEQRAYEKAPDAANI